MMSTEKDTKLAVFEGRRIRKTFHEGQWWFVVEDVVLAREGMDKNRWMCADVHVERNGVHWVLDAKYKRDFGCEHRADRFQASPYALGFATQRATLVYPTGSRATGDLRLLLNAKIGKRNVRIDSIELPMAEGPEACKEVLESLCGLSDSGAVGQENGRYGHSR